MEFANLLRDALKTVFDWGKESNKFVTLDIPGGRRLVSMPNGEMQTFDIDPLQQDDKLADLSSLHLWVEDRNESECHIFITDDMVRAELDRRDNGGMYDTAVVHLQHSHFWQYLTACKTIKQKDFLRALRGPLADCCSSSVYSVFASLDFSRRNDSAAIIAKGKESLGRSVELAAQSRGGEIPDWIIFNGPLWSLANSPQVEVKIGIDVSVETESISLFGVGETFTLAEQAALMALRGSVESMWKPGEAPPIFLARK